MGRRALLAARRRPPDAWLMPYMPPTASHAGLAPPAPSSPPSVAVGPPEFRVEVQHWRAVASWTWDAGDDVCGICRAPFDGAPPDAKFPGDDAPVVWGACSHAFHLQCITRWLGAQSEQRCPFCRRAWEFKAADGQGGGGGGAAGAAPPGG